MDVLRRLPYQYTQLEIGFLPSSDGVGFFGSEKTKASGQNKTIEGYKVKLSIRPQKLNIPIPTETLQYLQKTGNCELEYEDNDKFEIIKIYINEPESSPETR